MLFQKLLCFFFTTQGLSDDRRNSFPQSFPRWVTHFSKDKSVSKSSIWKKSLSFNSSINKENLALIWYNLIQWLAILGQPYANGKLNLPDPKSNIYGWETMIKLVIISVPEIWKSQVQWIIWEILLKCRFWFPSLVQNPNLYIIYRLQEQQHGDGSEDHALGRKNV